MDSPPLGRGVLANWDGVGDMGFYVVTLAALFMVAFAFVMMLFVKQRPPESWGDWAYSNSSFAKWIEELRNKSRILGPLHIDRFRMASFVGTTAVFGASVVTFIIDLSTGMAITEFLGDIGVAITLLCVIVIPVFYEASLTIWWSIVDRASIQSNDIKRLKSIEKGRKKKK